MNTKDKQELLNTKALPNEKTPNALQSTQQKISNGASLLAQVSTLAWNLVIPIVGGVLLGHYLDKKGEQGVTWTLSLLVMGVMLAFSNLYNLYVEHRHNHLEEEKSNLTDKVPHAKEK